MTAKQIEDIAAAIEPERPVVVIHVKNGRAVYEGAIYPNVLEATLAAARKLGVSELHRTVIES